ALPATAARHPVTVADAAAERTPRPGSGAITWAPDGKRFAFRERNGIWVYDLAAKSRREVVALAALREKAVQPPAAEAFDWQNRRVVESRFQWSADSERLLVSEQGDLFLVTVENGKWGQLTRTAASERDAKLSPDGRRVVFRRDHDLYSLAIDGRKET